MPTLKADLRGTLGSTSIGRAREEEDKIFGNDSIDFDGLLHTRLRNRHGPGDDIANGA